MSQKRRSYSSRGASQSQRQSGKRSAQELEEDSIFTQPSTSQVLRGLDNFTPAQVEQKTAEMVQYFLVKDQKKLPLRRSDIIKHVMKEYRNVYPEIIKRAARILEQVFGLKLVEIDTKNHIYILVNNLEAGEPASKNTPTDPKLGLLFVILGIIFMKGGVVREILVWNTLKKLRIDVGEKHEQFGDVKKLVTDEFVRQRYLEYTRIPHTEPLEYELSWGQRAEVEVPRVKILELMGELHECEPQVWTQQYRTAHASSTASSQASPSTSQK